VSALAWPLLLLALAVVLLVAEVFVPSGGLIGLLGICCLGLSLWEAFQHSTEFGLLLLAGDSILLPMTMAVAFYLWPKTPLARRVFLKPPTPEEIVEPSAVRYFDHLVGRFGKTLTPLRPSGLVDFDGRRLDGISEDGLIPAGALIVAVRSRSGRVVVRSARLLPEALNGRDQVRDVAVDLSGSPAESNSTRNS
jgi:membrane-bound ClpP family serine protease